MIEQFYFKSFSLVSVNKFKCQTVLFDPLIGRTLSGATTPNQSELGSDSNKGVHRIPQSSSITGTSGSDVSAITRTFAGGILPVCRDAVHVFYNPIPADWAIKF